MKLSTKILILIFLVIVDYLLISLYLRNQNLEPSIAIAIIVLVPIAFLINILIGITFFFYQKDVAYKYFCNQRNSFIYHYLLFIWKWNEAPIQFRVLSVMILCLNSIVIKREISLIWVIVYHLVHQGIF